jgi:hypothetical protein
MRNTLFLSFLLSMFCSGLTAAEGDKLLLTMQVRPGASSGTLAELARMAVARHTTTRGITSVKELLTATCRAPRRTTTASSS